MGSLVEELQAEALERSVPLTDLLRKAKTVAVKLGHAEFTAWVDREMSGYHSHPVPPYRKLRASVRFLNPVRGWCPVVNGDHQFDFGASIGEIFALLQGNSSFFGGPVPKHMADDVMEGLGFTVDVQRRIPRAAVAAIDEAVRNAVLDWALKLEAAGIRGEGLSFTRAEAEKAKSMVINIGSITNASGIGSFGDNATISATQTVNVGQLAEGARQLVAQAESLIPASDLPGQVKTRALTALAELRAVAHEPEPRAEHLRSALESLKHVMEHAAGHVVGAGILAGIARIVGGGH